MQLIAEFALKGTRVLAKSADARTFGEEIAEVVDSTVVLSELEGSGVIHSTFVRCRLSRHTLDHHTCNRCDQV